MNKNNSVHFYLPDSNEFLIAAQIDFDLVDIYQLQSSVMIQYVTDDLQLHIDALDETGLLVSFTSQDRKSVV